MYAKHPAIAVACLSLVGCVAPPEMLSTPSGSAPEWNHRQWFDTPTAGIYASNAEAARDAADLINTVAERFTNDTGAEPPHGLVIVTDTNDDLVIPNGNLVLTLGWRRARVMTGKLTPDKGELQWVWMLIGAWSKKMDLPVEDLLRHIPLPLDEPALKDSLHIPPDIAESAAWIVAVPTLGSLREAACRMLPAFLKAAGIGPIARTLVAPIHGLIEAAAVAEYAKLRQALLYAELVTTHPDGSPKEKSRRVNAYLKARKIKLFNKKKRAPRKRPVTKTKQAQ